MSNILKNTIWNLKAENNEHFKDRRILKQIGTTVFVTKYVYSWGKMLFWNKYNVSICFESVLKLSTFCIKISPNIFI